MKGVVLAGGLGTRLYPLTFATNKHLLPVYNQPMIFYPIKTLVNAGIKEIMVVTGGPHAGDFIRVLQNGKELGVNHLEYAYQDDALGGIAHALSLARDFAGNEPLVVILGDNTTDADITKPVKNFIDGALIFLKKVPDPQRFGVPVFTKRQITRIEEKPKVPKSSYAVTGLYIYDATVFTKISKIKPSKRGQLEITDVNNFYIQGNKLHWVELPGFWRDAGTFQTLFEASAYWASKAQRAKKNGTHRKRV
ncbi:NTP transferase domain-containing protein [Candidatus Microgenomates bacterium]|nr:NTP transferase domain-containing protein [Candidatus Microgenomates bacterium]